MNMAEMRNLAAEILARPVSNSDGWALQRDYDALRAALQLNRAVSRMEDQLRVVGAARRLSDNYGGEARIEDLDALRDALQLLDSRFD